MKIVLYNARFTESSNVANSLCHSIELHWNKWRKKQHSLHNFTWSTDSSRDVQISRKHTEQSKMHNSICTFTHHHFIYFEIGKNLVHLFTQPIFFGSFIDKIHTKFTLFCRHAHTVFDKQKKIYFNTTKMTITNLPVHQLCINHCVCVCISMIQFENDFNFDFLFTSIYFFMLNKLFLWLLYFMRSDMKCSYNICFI